MFVTVTQSCLLAYSVSYFTVPRTVTLQYAAASE